MKPRSSTPVLILILLVAAVLRLAHVGQLDPGQPIHSDAARYYLYASNLVNHGVYSSSAPGERIMADSYRSPGYPLFLAALLVLFDGQSFLRAAWVLQALLGVIVVLLTYLLAHRVLPHPWVLVPTALVAFSPHLIAMSGYLLTESLQSLLLVLGVVLCIRVGERPTTVNSVIAGGILGIAYLVNEVALLLPFLYVVAMHWSRLCGRRHIALMLGAFLLFPSAWMLRNSTLPTEGQQAADRVLAAAAQGTYPDFLYQSEAYRNFPYREDPQYGQMTSSLSGFLSILNQRVADRPLRYLSWYLLEKPYVIWQWRLVQGVDDIHVYPVVHSLFLDNGPAAGFKQLMRGLHHLLVVGFLLGIAITASQIFSCRGWQHLPAIGRLVVHMGFAALLYWTLVYTVLLALPRYGIPWRPLFYLLSVSAAHWIYSEWGRGRHQLSEPGIADGQHEA